MVLLLCLILSLGGPPSHAQEADLLTHIFHVRAEIDVDKQTIRYDELVECRAVQRNSRSPLNFELRRRYIAKGTRDGGAIVLYTPDAFCRLWHQTWDPSPLGAPEAQLSPRYIPRLYWIDDIKNPTYIEAYLSEAYHEQPTRRVVIKQFEARPARHPVPPETLAEARAQEKADPPMHPIHARGCGAYCWQSIEFAPIPESEWRQIPELASVLSLTAPEQGLVYLSEAQRKLLDRFKFNKITSWTVLQLGIPRRGEDHGLIGLPPRSSLDRLSSERLARTADELIPVRCTDDVCRLSATERGYVIFYHKEKIRGAGGFQWIEIAGTKIKQQDYRIWRGAVFDPRTRNVLIRDTTLR